MNSTQKIHILALCTMSANGEVVDAITLEFPVAIRRSSLTDESFSLEGATIERASLYEHIGAQTEVESGHVVVLHLATQLSTLYKEGEQVIHQLMPLSVRQERELLGVDNTVLAPWSEGRPVLDTRHDLLDAFETKQYHTPLLKQPLEYSLFLPEDYDPSQRYPLLLFIHDRGVISEEQRLGLVQGMGGTVWVEKAEQEERPCIVVVPHYRRATVNDRFEATEEVSATYDLLTEVLLPTYAIDERRIYGTGQSMGCMSLSELGIRHPDFFAALLLIAGQWDPRRFAAMKDLPMWVVVGQGDSRAFNGMNDCMAALEAANAEIRRDYPDGNLPVPEYEQIFSEIAQWDSGPIYTVFKDNSVVRPEFGVDADLPMMLQNHMATWRLAYQIRVLREWLFSKQKD